ncbi:Single-stranded-DNA-specific exonuclease RecJ [Candidatus Riesia pediculischaeffi PTSU]|uniref:Single-stranded-DNA-specific exonuclease RecJ n=1 Tax=Candidatus Riesia pediculischaeffi PTSU TaxID=1401651 RepID=A0A0C1S9L0_9ENTR|nr:DHH family phosphoesterase [Candidatus Riesia pediculischaeffi]KIE63966.1 Single-stranded-DNA-specific exonuclease RecJ [Candidatus Riesia pediculischaeffi PTSU]
MKLIRREKKGDCKLNNLPSILQRIYSSRGISSEEDLELSIRSLLDYRLLTDIKKAVNLLIRALYDKWRIVVVGDFDVDGATSTALLIRILKKLGYNSVDYFIPNRFKDGYGLTKTTVQKVIKKKFN